MCMEYTHQCECGSREASFHFQDNLVPPEVISKLYCPLCSKDREFDPDTMIADNGWIVQYDMEMVEFASRKFPQHVRANLTPKTLFDGNYATWRGIYPGDHIDSVKEREEIIKLAKVDPQEYLVKIRTWANERMERLAREGWRKANAA